MTVTYEARIKDVSLYPVLQQYAELYGDLERSLFRDLYIQHQPLNDLKRDYISTKGITGRQFNSLRIGLDGKLKAAKECLLLKEQTLKDKLKAVQKTVKELEAKLKPLKPTRSRKAKPVLVAATSTLTQPVAATTALALPIKSDRAKLRFKLHQKKRKWFNLKKRLRLCLVCFGES